MPSGHVGNLDHRGSNMGSVEMSEKLGSDLAWQVMHWPGSKETPLCFSSVLCWSSGVHYPSCYSASLSFLCSHGKGVFIDAQPSHDLHCVIPLV